MASKPKHRKIKPSTHTVSSENEETTASEEEKSLSDEATASEDEKSSSDETTSTECKFDYCIVIEYCYDDFLLYFLMYNN